MKIYNIDKLNEDVNCPISIIGNIDVDGEKIYYLLRYFWKIYDVKLVTIYFDHIEFRITSSDWFQNIRSFYDGVEIVNNKLYMSESIEDRLILNRLKKIKKIYEKSMAM